MSDHVVQASVEGTPANWRKVALGEIYDIGSSKRVLQKQWKNSGVPFYRAREIVKLARDGFVANDLFISEEHFAELEKAKGVPQPGDLMVSAVGTLGACYAVQPGDRFYFKDASVLSFRPIAPIDPRFMQYAFLWNGLLDQVKSGEGATVGTFTIARAKATEFLLPPSGEQKRIVAVLDQAFAALDRARAHAEANLANADSLFLEILRDRFARDTVRFGSVALEELAEHVTDGDHQPPPKAEVGIPFITISNLEKRTREIDLTDTFHVSREYFDALPEKRKPRFGDVLYTVTGSFGIPILVRDTCGDFCFQRHIGLIRPEVSVDSSWLSYMLLSPQAVEQANIAATGTAQRTVSLKALRGLQLPNTPESMQRIDAQEFDELWRRCAFASSVYTERLMEIAALRQSLLQKAFSGELA